MKPPIDSLGLCACISVHEHALREAQKTIDGLRRELEMVRAQLKEAQASSMSGILTDEQKAYIAEGFHPHACHPAQRVTVVPMEHEI